MPRHGGENWITVKAAARRLRVPEAHLHRRAPRHLELKRLGDAVCIRESDVEQLKAEGLPEPYMEGLADGSLIASPARWLVARPRWHGGREHGYIALRPLAMGPDPARELQPGDIVSVEAGEGSLLDAMVRRGDLAELPTDRGVLGLIRLLLERENALETHLALAAVYSERHTRGRHLADHLIELGLITEEQFTAARDFADEPHDLAVNDGRYVDWLDEREREFVAERAQRRPEVRAAR